VRQVQNRSKAQQEFFGLVEARAIGRAAIDEPGIGEAGNRMRGPQIAKRAGRVLDVGFDLVERVVEARVPLVDEALQCVENTRVGGRRMDPGGDAIEQRRVSRDGASVEQGEQKLGVVDFEPREIVHLADLVPDREAQVPQRMQDGAHPAFFRGSDLAVEQEEDVDVRLQAELPSAVAAERDDEAGIAIRRDDEQAGEQIVDTVREALQRRAAALAARRRRRQLRARRFNPGERHVSKRPVMAEG
jgi:hypothetical protein